MEHRNRYDGVHPRAIQFVRYHARQLARHRAVPGMELEDYEQDLITDLIAREPRFDPTRATYPTFADRVIRHRVSTLIQAGLRMRRIEDHGPRAVAAGPSLETQGDSGAARAGPRTGARSAWTSSASSDSSRCAFAVAANGCWPRTGGRPRRHWGCTAPLYEAAHDLKRHAIEAGLHLLPSDRPHTRHLRFLPGR